MLICAHSNSALAIFIIGPLPLIQDIYFIEYSTIFDHSFSVDGNHLAPDVPFVDRKQSTSCPLKAEHIIVIDEDWVWCLEILTVATY